MIELAFSSPDQSSNTTVNPIKQALRALIGGKKLRDLPPDVRKQVVAQKSLLKKQNQKNQWRDRSGGGTF